ncbi:hypothetical protein BDY19DRAFT_41156 [Irpex rosettiformis]|uniref:Uncharacterized protein n=1 Tax=Irpex rosettiformis TaxID=378272 RepID=A0ACB8UM82_9APHY|nr:hypothetical protein BDY19DRAFT_41156 [Irpex rosettiformis]
MVVLDPSWFDRTFSSQAKAESVLRPYLEAGTINEHDYNLAVSFLPGNHRYWPMLYSIGATVLTASYGRFIKRPPWSINRMVGISSGANVLGFLIGQVKRASAHQQFIKSLDDRQAFVDTLIQIAGGEPSAPQLPGRTTTAAYPKDDAGVATTPRQDEDFADSSWPNDPNIAPRSSSPTQPPPVAPIAEHPQVISRWDEIRAVNAHAGKSSTWDVLRQTHERRQIPDSTQSTEVPSTPPLNDAEVERAREQARFDALLEAERKAAGRTS